jgi:nitrate reductase gamma subunit
MIAGLAFQVATMTAFVLLALDYTWRVRKQTRASGQPLQTLCSKQQLWLFSIFFGIGVLGIYIRTIYRVVELAGGWTSKLYRTQVDFIVLEGV